MKKTTTYDFAGGISQSTPPGKTTKNKKLPAHHPIAGARGLPGPQGPAGPSGGGGGLLPSLVNAPGIGAKMWFGINQFSNNGAADTFTGNNLRCYYMPFMLGRSCTVDKLAVHVTAASNNAGHVIRVGIFAPTADNFPGARLYTSADLAVGTGTGQFSQSGVALALTAGVMYWAAYVENNTGTVCTVRGVGGNNQRHDMMGFLDTFLNAQARGAFFEDLGAALLPAVANPTATIAGTNPEVFAQFV